MSLISAGLAAVAVAAADAAAAASAGGMAGERRVRVDAEREGLCELFRCRRTRSNRPPRPAGTISSLQWHNKKGVDRKR